jgi:hypothetical protein
MGNWHTCETTHCRAGWVVYLAGEAGYALEKKTSTLFAAMMIYKVSDPVHRVSPGRFFETNEVALADMKRLAELERGKQRSIENYHNGPSLNVHYRTRLRQRR